MAKLVFPAKMFGVGDFKMFFPSKSTIVFYNTGYYRFGVYIVYLSREGESDKNVN